MSISVVVGRLPVRNAPIRDAARLMLYRTPLYP